MQKIHHDTASLIDNIAHVAYFATSFGLTMLTDKDTIPPKPELNSLGKASKYVGYGAAVVLIAAFGLMTWKGKVEIDGDI